MERDKAIYGRAQQKNKQGDSSIKKRGDRFDLIIKNEKVKIKLQDEYIEVILNNKSNIYGVLSIKRLYINKNIKLSINQCYQISKYIKIFFIDRNGYIIAQYKRFKR